MFSVKIFSTFVSLFTSRGNSSGDLHNTGFRGQNENFLADIVVNVVLVTA